MDIAKLITPVTPLFILLVPIIAALLARWSAGGGEAARRKTIREDFELHAALGDGQLRNDLALLLEREIFLYLGKKAQSLERRRIVFDAVWLVGLSLMGLLLVLLLVEYLRSGGPAESGFWGAVFFFGSMVVSGVVLALMIRWIYRQVDARDLGRVEFLEMLERRERAAWLAPTYDPERLKKLKSKNASAPSADTSSDV